MSFKKGAGSRIAIDVINICFPSDYPRNQLCERSPFRRPTEELYRFLRDLAYHDGMVETRIAPRYRVMKPGTIEFRGQTIDCMIRDLSTTGAALEVPHQRAVPDKFVLAMPGDGLHLPCHVVWRKDYRIGVTFD